MLRLFIILIWVCLVFQKAFCLVPFPDMLKLEEMFFESDSTLRLSPLRGILSAERISNYYRYGNRNSATIRLIRSLFTEVDRGRVIPTKLGNMAATHITPSIVREIISVLDAVDKGTIANLNSKKNRKKYSEEVFLPLVSQNDSFKESIKIYGQKAMYLKDEIEKEKQKDRPDIKRLEKLAHDFKIYTINENEIKILIGHLFERAVEAYYEQKNSYYSQNFIFDILIYFENQKIKRTEDYIEVLRHFYPVRDVIRVESMKTSKNLLPLGNLKEVYVFLNSLSSRKEVELFSTGPSTVPGTDETFGDCVSTTFRNILNILAYNNEKKSFDRDKLVGVSSDIGKYYEEYDNIYKQDLEEARARWNLLSSELKGVGYERYGKYEIKTGYINFEKLVGAMTSYSGIIELLRSSNKKVIIIENNIENDFGDIIFKAGNATYKLVFEPLHTSLQVLKIDVDDELDLIFRELRDRKDELSHFEDLIGLLPLSRKNFKTLCEDPQKNNIKSINDLLYTIFSVSLFSLEDRCNLLIAIVNKHKNIEKSHLILVESLFESLSPQYRIEIMISIVKQNNRIFYPLIFKYLYEMGPATHKHAARLFKEIKKMGVHDFDILIDEFLQKQAEDKLAYIKHELDI